MDFIKMQGFKQIIFNTKFKETKKGCFEIDGIEKFYPNEIVIEGEPPGPAKVKVIFPLSDEKRIVEILTKKQIKIENNQDYYKARLI